MRSRLNIIWEVLRKLLGLSETQMWKVNSLICWINPLSHATYDKHDFGHDNQPSLWQLAYVLESGHGR